MVMFACTVQAHRLMCRTAELVKRDLPSWEIECHTRCSALPEISMPVSVSEKTAAVFGHADALVYFTASGIAVRAVAPCVRDKLADPAVIVIDETGKYCISLLSGHMGGANRLAEYLAELIGAEPVITTATDREKKFSVDSYARIHGLVLSGRTKAKMISVRVLEGETVRIWAEPELRFGDLPVSEAGDSPEGQEEREKPAHGKIGAAISSERGNADVIISWRRDPGDPDCLYLIPKAVVLGIGCRRGTPERAISDEVQEALAESGIFQEAVCRVATIDLKAHEAGLLEFAARRGLEVRTYPAEELQSVKGTFSSSEFVKKTTGTDNVCERSAVRDAGGRLVMRKHAGHGVTCAAAVRSDAAAPKPDMP